MAAIFDASWWGRDVSGWVWVLADAAAKGALLLAAAGLVAVALRRASAAARHMVWFIALAAVLALPVVSAVLPSWRLPVLPRAASAEVEPTDVAAVSERPALPMPSPAAPAYAPLAEFPAMPPAMAPTERALPAEAAAVRVHWSVWALGASAVGTAALLCYLLAGTVCAWQIARAARHVPEDSPWRRAAEGIRWPGLRLLESERIAVPMMWGLWRPFVLLPADTEDWSDERRRVVLLHELAHLERHDCWTQALAQLACAFYWFNPLAWLAARRMRIERERACDDRVLGAGLRASSYADHLLQIARTMPGLRCGAIGAVAMARASQLEGRLLAILDPRRSRRTLTRLALALALLAAACILPPLAAARLAVAEEPPVADAAEPAKHGAAAAEATADEAAAQQDLQDLIDAAPPGSVVTVPPGIYTTPLLIDRPLTLKGDDPENCVIELTADEPCIVVSSREPVIIDSLTIKWQLATSEATEGPACALTVKDGNASIRNCRFVALGSMKRCPSALQCLGFSNVNLASCTFEGFEYTVAYSGGAEGGITDCLVLNPGHCGITVYSGSKLEIARTIVTGSGYHAIRSTGGILLAHDNLIINNKNRGFYLGNRSASGRLSNNVILGNGTGISAFAQTDVAIENNLILRSEFAGLGARDSCPITVRNNVFLENPKGIAVFEAGGRNRVTLGRNTFWNNQRDTESVARPGDSILVDPRFRAVEQGDFFPQADELRTAAQGLSDPGVFLHLWKRWNAVSGEPEPEGAAVASPWRATLPNGATIELLGLSHHPSAGRQWWAPDGTPLAEAPYDETESRHSDADVELAFRLWGDTDDVATRLKVEGADGWASCGPVFKAGEEVAGLRAVAISGLAESMVSTSVRIGVASGGWTTRARGPKGVGLVAPDGRADVSLRRAGSDTFVSVADTFVDLDCRVVAQDADGELHHLMERSMSSDGALRHTTARFRGLPLERIAEVRFETRSYEWAEFRNVSLKVGHRTDVGVVIEGEVTQRVKPETRGAAAEPTPLTPGPVGGRAAESRVLRKEFRQMLDEIAAATQTEGRRPPREMRDPDWRAKLEDDLRKLGVLQVTAEEEAAFAAGQFKDEENAKRLYEAIRECGDLAAQLPLASRLALHLQDAGELEGARLELARRILEAQLEAPLAAAASVTFGPVIERTLYDAPEKPGFVDFETGRLYTMPPGMTRTGGLFKTWVNGCGIDASVDVAPPEPLRAWLNKECRTFHKALPANRWEEVTPEEVQELLAMPNAGLHVRIDPGEEPQEIFAFRTTQGGMGVLRIVGFTPEDPPGVRIRYKMLQEGAGGRPGTGRAATSRAPAMLSSGPGAHALRVGEWEGFYGVRNGRVVFLVITDGQAEGPGVSNTIIIGPRWSGGVRPRRAGSQAIPCRADARTATIGEDRYSLAEGRVFVVLTSGEAPVVKQLAIQLETCSTVAEVEEFVATSEELRALTDPAGALTFGPVIEQWLSTDNTQAGFLDIDTGKEFVGTKRAYGEGDYFVRQVREDGVDVAAMDEPQSYGRGLMAFDMQLVENPPTHWTASPQTYVSQLNEVERGETPKIKSDYGFPEAFADFFQALDVRGKELPATFLFRTREGGVGILQIVGFTEEPEGVKIRYKMVQPQLVPLGKAIERVLYPEDMPTGIAVDILTGRRVHHSQSQAYFQWSRLAGEEWAHAVGISASGVHLRGPSRDTRGGPPQDLWSAVSAEDLPAFDGDWASDSYFIGPPSSPPPYTTAFRTRDGAVGVLVFAKVEGQNVHLRYRLLKGPEAGEGEPGEGQSTAEAAGERFLEALRTGDQQAVEDVLRSHRQLVQGLLSIEYEDFQDGKMVGLVAQAIVEGEPRATVRAAEGRVQARTGAGNLCSVTLANCGGTYPVSEEGEDSWEVAAARATLQVDGERLEDLLREGQCSLEGFQLRYGDKGAVAGTHATVDFRADEYAIANPVVVLRSDEVTHSEHTDELSAWPLRIVAARGTLSRRDAVVELHGDVEAKGGNFELATQELRLDAQARTLTARSGFTMRVRDVRAWDRKLAITLTGEDCRADFRKGTVAIDRGARVEVRGLPDEFLARLAGRSASDLAGGELAVTSSGPFTFNQPEGSAQLNDFRLTVAGKRIIKGEQLRLTRTDGPEGAVRIEATGSVELRREGVTVRGESIELLCTPESIELLWDRDGLLFLDP